MQLVFSTIRRKQIQLPPSVIPLIENENENKPQLQRGTPIFAPTPIPNPFQFMIERIQYENQHCNSCGKK